MCSYNSSCQFAKNLLLVIMILFMKFKSYEFTSQYSHFVYGQSHNSTLRFRDFEPRYAVKTETELMTIPRRFSNAGSLISRKSRGFQFHADEQDVVIDIEFVVPFIRVPIERSMEVGKTAFRSLLNLNINSLLTTGAIVAVGGALMVILKLLFSPFAGIGALGKTSRNGEGNLTYPNSYENSVENESLKSNNIIEYVETKLHEHNINLSKCAQRSICDYVRRSSEEVKSGSASSLQKVLDGILSLKSVKKAIKGTAVQEAVNAARNGTDCSLIYEDCPWNKRTRNMIKTIIKIIKFLNFT